jgi:SAM-dependent methyltransferase
MRTLEFRTDPAVRGFDRAAEAYERGRPDYPAPAVRYLGRVLAIRPHRTVVELGSGTGKFTRALARLGCAVVAVEPTPGMRRVFARELPHVAVLPGAAESIPFPDGAADAVVAAQAFQWFRHRRALREIARVLRPGGGLGLVWNVRDESARWTQEVSRILGRYSRSATERRWKGLRAIRRSGSPFSPVRERRFAHIQHATPAEVVDRFLSVSAIAVLPAAERRKVAAEIREVLRADPATRGRAAVELAYVTEVYWTRLRR